ncbi:MAG: NAD-binding protein [Cyanobacteria bacterium P01_H01_bin.121]
MAVIDQRYQRLQRELFLGVSVLTGVIVMGIIGYHVIEGWDFLDSAYMTVITLSTVGFSEIQPLTPQGRVFTIVLIFMGIVSIGYIVNRFTEAVIQDYFQKGIRQQRRRRLLQNLQAHYILCGFGRTGSHIAIEFATEKIPFIVVDVNGDAVEDAQNQGYIALQADATLDETLTLANIAQALCIVAALPSDAENLYTVLSAKTLNPRIRAIARANTEDAIQKLQRAGADAVISPYITGGRRMAAAALRPQVMDFVDGIMTGGDRAYYMEEFLIETGKCPYIGLSLQTTQLRADTGTLVVAIRRQDGQLIVGPTGATYLQAGDVLICMGTADQLRLLNQLLLPLDLPSLRLPRHPER